MAEKQYTVIQLPEWDGWRIAGNDREWQIQRRSEGRNGVEWRGTNYWPSIEYAVAFAYERTLRECGGEFESLGLFVAECHRVKDELVMAVIEVVG